MASGDSLALFVGGSGNPETSSPAAVDARNSILCYDFDDGTDESVDFVGIMPESYAGTTGVTVTIMWAATTATTGDVVWNAQWSVIAADTDDIDTHAFAAANAGTFTTAGTSGHLSYDDITFTDGADMDSVTGGDFFILRVTRDANNGSDTMSGDAEIFGVEVKET